VIKNVPDYPTVHDELTTVRMVLDGRSLARFGDGEVRLAIGGSAVSQKFSKGLRNELRRIAAQSKTKALVGIPNVNSHTPLFDKCWKNHSQPKYRALWNQKAYYCSSFITRPDSAPWINTKEYWTELAGLWVGRAVTLVVGTDATSLTPDNMVGVNSVRVVTGPRRDAYEDINRIEEEIGIFTQGPVLMCLGACATVLAERLAKKGLWAVDIGNVGKFMPRKDGSLWKLKPKAKAP
jgi:hypothetical protein